MDKFLEIVNKQLDKSGWTLEEKKNSIIQFNCPNCRCTDSFGDEIAFCAAFHGEGCLQCSACNKYIADTEWMKEGVIVVIKRLKL